MEKHDIAANVNPFLPPMLTAATLTPSVPIQAEQKPQLEQPVPAARTLSSAQLQAFASYLRAGEHSCGTVQKYLRDVRNFCGWLAAQPQPDLSHSTALAWKQHLLDTGYRAVTVNSMLAALNSFLRFCGWEDCCVKALRVQRRTFRDPARELSRAEYQRLLQTAQALNQQRLALIIESIGATGVRVSELRYMTVEAARSKRTDIALKGKIRSILLPGKLCRKLLKYARQQGISSGPIFVSRTGCCLSRRQIWSELKRLCGPAGVDSSKVFPHNLRHLFATAFYALCHDIVKLADILGHSSLETTRLYLLTTGAEHMKQLERLNLVT